MSDISKRPEKIASAIYLLTSFFNDREPLKWRLRELGAELASLGTFVRDSFYQDSEKTIFDIRSIVVEVSTLLSVARNSGLLSGENFSLLNEELNKYLNSLEYPLGIEESSGKAILSRNFFQMVEEGRELDSNAFPRLKSKEPGPEVVKDNLNNVSKVESEPQKRVIEKGHLPAVVTNNLKDYGLVSAKKSNRQSVIIGLLKRKKEIMIKDVTPLIKGCSEKTIQRELAAMVEAGLLRREGEKRWSRYSLIRP